jgi:hypothetical protein
MFRDSLGLANPEVHADLDLKERATWLRETLQLDTSSSNVRILASKLTQLLRSDRSKALALHDYVKSLPWRLPHQGAAFCSAAARREGARPFAFCQFAQGFFKRPA